MEQLNLGNRPETGLRRFSSVHESIRPILKVRE